MHDNLRQRFAKNQDLNHNMTQDSDKLSFSVFSGAHHDTSRQFKTEFGSEKNQHPQIEVENLSSARDREVMSHSNSQMSQNSKDLHQYIKYAKLDSGK